MLDCSIDNKSYGTIDQYTPWSGGLHLPWTFIFADTLSGGSHQLTLTTSTNKNSGSKGTACRIHRFTVNNP
jgi:sialidase-1